MVTSEATKAWSEWDGLLVLDATGRIAFCSSNAGELLGRSSTRVVGQQVCSLIPELPFWAQTPEFNLAYVKRQGEEAIWERQPLRTCDGRMIVLDISLGTCRDVGLRSIVMILKHSAALPGIAGVGCKSAKAQVCVH